MTAVKPVRVRFVSQLGTEHFVDGYPTGVPGLVVNESYLSCGNEPCYLVTHARSGMAFSHCWTSPEGALAYAQALEVYTDWQQGLDGLKHSLKGFVVTFHEKAVSLGGTFHGLPNPPGKIPLVDNGMIA